MQMLSKTIFRENKSKNNIESLENNTFLVLQIDHKYMFYYLLQ